MKYLKGEIKKTLKSYKNEVSEDTLNSIAISLSEKIDAEEDGMVLSSELKAMIKDELEARSII